MPNDKTEKPKGQLKRVENALCNLVMDEPFFATLALRFRLEERDDVQTFCTDGKNLFFNPVFCAGLKDREILTVLAHEVLHCALGHLWRMPFHADHETWNEAADHETNWTLEETNETAKNGGNAEPFPFPDKNNICMSPEFKGMAAEKIYAELSKRKKPKGENQQGEGEGQQNTGQGKGNQQGKGNKKPSMGEFVPVLEESKASELKEEWNKATIQAAHVSKNRGNVPSQMKRLIEEIKNPKINWKQVLREFLRELAENDYNFLKPNPRFSDTDFFLPSLKDEAAGNIVFAIDTSGSITDENLKDFISEAQGCLDELCPKKLTIISCDAKVHEIENFEPGDKIKSSWKGGGGTNFIPVFKELEKEKENPDILVYITDLDGTFPSEEPDFPVLWVWQKMGSRVPGNVPFGNVIEIQD